MQRRLESKTEDVSSMSNEDDPCRDGDLEDSVVDLEVEDIRNRHLRSPLSALDLAVTVEVFAVASRAVVEVGSEAGSEETEIEVGTAAEEEVLAMIEGLVVVMVVVHHLMLLAVLEEEVDMEVTTIDATAMEVVGMVVDATEAGQVAIETP